VTAYDASGVVSGFSNQVAFATPAAPPTPALYTLTASAGSGGSITPSGSAVISEGSNQSYAIAPAAGYKIAGVTVDGASVGAVASYTFSNIAANHIIAATFAVNSYTLSASAGAGGTISPAGTATVNSGVSQTYTITPASGYKVADVTVDGASIGAVSSYTFSNIAANHTISATFAVNSYTLSASAGTGGTISPAGTATVNSGGNQAYTITPASGYKVADVTVDGASIGAVSSYTFSNVTANHTISATFAVNSYTLSASVGTGGTISPAGTATVNSGASQSYAITAASGYKIAGVTVDGASVGAVASYTFSNVTANHTIAATFAAVTVSAPITSSATWQNKAIASQTGAFTASFDMIPSALNIDGVTGFSAVSAKAFTDLAAIVRFNTTGTIDARNGSAYAAKVAIPYSAGKVYHVRMQINVATHKYDVYVTSPGGAETQLSSGYAFRTEQAAVTVLNNLGIVADVGSHQVLNLSITSP
jgi:hypothetical protein